MVISLSRLGATLGHKPIDRRVMDWQLLEFSLREKRERSYDDANNRIGEEERNPRRAARTKVNMDVS